MNEEEESQNQTTEVSQIENYFGNTPHTKSELINKADTSREQVENAENESRSAGSSLLDKLEASRAEQGEYFYEIGDSAEQDRRLVAFKAPVIINEGDEPRAIVVTRDGAFYLAGGTTHDYRKEGVTRPFQHSENGYQMNNPTGDFIKRMEEIQRGENSGDYIPPTEDSDAYVYTHGYGSHENQMFFYLKPLNSSDLVLSAISESIKITESPFKKRIKEAQAKTNTINTISTGVSNLPARE